VRFSLLLICCACVGFHEEGRLDHAIAFGPVDLSVTRLYYPETPANGVMLEYRFGNRTGHGVPIDLRALHVEIDGHEALLYDPRGEIHVARLGPEGAGDERLVYLSESDEPPRHVCLRLNGHCTEVGP
jgi:hypothetical protein